MRIKRNAEEWKSIFNEQKTSGKTVKQFCLTNKIAQSLFYKKRRALTECVTQEFVQIPVTKIPTSKASESIRIGKIEINPSEDMADGYLIKLIRCALEAHDAYLS